MVNDSELIAQSRGDHSAFAALFDRHSDAVFRYAFGITRNADLAQDLVQETFITAWKRLADIHLVGDSMLPWLIVACRNHGANQSRSRALRSTVPLDDQTPDDSDDPLTRLQHREELGWVLRAVAELNETDQLIISLCLEQGRSYQEAAKMLGMRTNTLTKRIQRARAYLLARPPFPEGEANT